VEVELKAVGQLRGAERAILINYLKAAKQRVGLLLNVGARSLGFERFVRGEAESA
jgi:GxxExxY protein